MSFHFLLPTVNLWTDSVSTFQKGPRTAFSQGTKGCAFWKAGSAVGQQEGEIKTPDSVDAFRIPLTQNEMNYLFDLFGSHLCPFWEVGMGSIVGCNAKTVSSFTPYSFQFDLKQSFLTLLSTLLG